MVDNNFLVKIKLANNIEMARGTLKRLEKMIRDSPKLLNSENIKKFYGVYRDCRFVIYFMSFLCQFCTVNSGISVLCMATAVLRLIMNIFETVLKKLDPQDFVICLDSVVSNVKVIALK